MKKRLALVLVLAAVAVMLVACGNKLIGTWEYEQSGVKVQMVFEKDGKGQMKMGALSVAFEWETDGDELTVKMEGSMLGQSYSEKQTSKYEIDGDTLTMKDTKNNTESKLTRVKD